MQMVSFKILVRAGVISSGGSSDFLVCIQKAQSAKASVKALLPRSTVIAQLFYPNGERVPGSDIKAALRALSSPFVSSLVSARLLKIAQKVPARSEASTATFCGDFDHFLAGDFGGAFCQAGVVAPPDSPIYGNFTVLNRSVF